MKLIIYLLLLDVNFIFASETVVQKSNLTDIKNPFVSASNAFKEESKYEVTKSVHNNDDLFQVKNDDRLKTDVPLDTVQYKNKNLKQRSVQNSRGNLFRDIISRQNVNVNFNERDSGNLNNIDNGNFFFNAQRFRATTPRANYGDGFPPTREIVVKQGRLYGVVRQLPMQSGLKSVDQFLGIPYAESPTGSRRFMPPGTPLPWSGYKMFNKMGPVCPQSIPDLSRPDDYTKGRYDQIKRLLPYLKDESEDCLYLNLYVPSWERFSQPTKYPVIVYIHGESFEWNSGNAYDGGVLASYGQIIVVTLNYRLGVLGFMKPGLGSQSIANFGLLDQIAALQWIKENIAAFGGDPTLVTVMGHGSGAVCVNFLMVSPVARGLFHRAILLSGSALSDWALSSHHQQITMQIAQGLNCPLTDDSDRLLNCLKNKTYTDMMNIRISTPKFSTPFGPIVDGMVIPDDPYKLMGQSSDMFSRYDLLFGMAELESYNILTATGITYGLLENERDNFLRFYMQNRYEVRPDVAFQAAIKEYTVPDFLRDPNKSATDLHRDTLLDIFSDARVAAPVIQTGLYLSKGNPKCFMYVFGHNSDDGEYGNLPQSIVGEDLPYIFGAPLGQIGPFQHQYTAKEKLFSQAIMKYFSNFVKTGNPKAPWRVFFYNENTPDLHTYDVDWPEFNYINQSYLHLGIPPVVGHHYRQRFMKFWNKDIVDVMKKQTENKQQFEYGRFYTPSIPRRSHPTLPTGHISMYPIKVDIEHPVDDPVRQLKHKLARPETRTHHVPINQNFQTTEPIDVEQIEDNQIARLEMTTFLTVSTIIICLLIVLLVALIYFYKKNKKVDNKYDSAKIFDAINDDKRSKFNDTDDSYLLDIIRKTSNGTYEQVKSPINGYKLARQTSSSTVDAHTKVSDWISNEISKYSPRVGPKNGSDSNTFSSMKKGEKVSVAIDATPQARSNSILRQEPIEITKAKTYDYGNPGKIICQEVEVDSSLIEEVPLRPFAEIRECSSSCSSIANCEECRFNHKHSYSDPVEIIYAPPKTYQEDITSFIEPDDINVTCRDDDEWKLPTSPEDSLKAIQKMNFPKVLPSYPENVLLSNSIKRRSLPPQYYMIHNTNSLNRDSLKYPPVPPPRLSSTLGRRPSNHQRQSNFMTSPLMVAEEPPQVEEPEITENKIIVGPLIPKENIYMTMKKKTRSRENSTSSFEGNQEVPPPENNSVNNKSTELKSADEGKLKDKMIDHIYAEIPKSTHVQMPQDQNESQLINCNPTIKNLIRQDSNSQSSSSSSDSTSSTSTSSSSPLSSSDDTASASSTGTIKKLD